MAASGEQIEIVHSHYVYSFEGIYEAIKIGINATHERSQISLYYHLL